MIKKFEYNVFELDKNYKFPVFNASTIKNPKNNTVIFLKKNSMELLNKLTHIKNCILILLPEMNAEYLKKSNLVIYDKNPRLRYAILMMEILNKNKKEIKVQFKNGYFYGENCSFGKDIVIEPFVKIGNNVIIGDNTIIKSGVKIGNDVIIGNNCYIRENSVIGGEGFGIEINEEGKNIRIPHIGGVIIEDNVEIGALNTVCSGTIEPTIVRQNVKTDDHVHIGHNDIIGEKSTLTAGSILSGSVYLKRSNYLGPNTTIRNGIEIAENASVSIGSVVTKDVEKNTKVTGNFAIPHEKFMKLFKFLLSKIE